MELAFEKFENGLVPVIVQDSVTWQVLMLGYMNAEALQVTQETGKVTFFSRSKQRLWTKGETSENFLWVKEILKDCDRDTLLVRATPAGPTCHTGTDTCFGEKNLPNARFLEYLEEVMQERLEAGEENSYTRRLWAKGVHKMAQKVGEEGVEVALEGVTQNRERLVEESADLLYHLLLLLKANQSSLKDVVTVLEERHR